MEGGNRECILLLSGLLFALSPSSPFPLLLPPSTQHCPCTPLPGLHYFLHLLSTYTLVLPFPSYISLSLSLSFSTLGLCGRYNALCITVIYHQQLKLWIWRQKVRICILLATSIYKKCMFSTTRFGEKYMANTTSRYNEKCISSTTTRFYEKCICSSTTTTFNEKCTIGFPFTSAEL